VLASEPPAEPEPTPAPQPPAAPVPIRPISETILRIPRPPAALPAEEPEERVAAQADSAELAARRAKLELLGIGDPGEGPVSDRRKVVAYRSSGAGVHPAEQAAAGMTPLHAVGSFWEASAREVAGAMTQVGVQSCGQCGLSLSATARFCRRCGTRQDQPA
jgi:ribosomal protein L40E